MFRILACERLIGTSEFEWRDGDMAVASGKFILAADYDAVRNVFLLFTQASGNTPAEASQDALAAYYQARDALELKLEASDHTPLETTWIHIVDWGGSISEEIEVQAQIADVNFWGAINHL